MASGVSSDRGRHTALVFIVSSCLYFLAASGFAATTPFWYDELFSVTIARLPRISDIIAALSQAADHTPPAIFILTRLAAVAAAYVTSRAAVHAYLHGKEGDPGNAACWYRRAGQPIAADPLRVGVGADRDSVAPVVSGFSRTDDRPRSRSFTSTSRAGKSTAARCPVDQRDDYQLSRRPHGHATICAGDPNDTDRADLSRRADSLRSTSSFALSRRARKSARRRHHRRDVSFTVRVGSLSRRQHQRLPDEAWYVAPSAASLVA